MMESATYRTILAQGRLAGRHEGLHDAIFALGRVKWGPPDDTTVRAIHAIHDTERLQHLVVRTTRASSWEDFLAD